MSALRKLTGCRHGEPVEFGSRRAHCESHIHAFCMRNHLGCGRLRMRSGLCRVKRIARFVRRPCFQGIGAFPPWRARHSPGLGIVTKRMGARRLCDLRLADRRLHSFLNHRFVKVMSALNSVILVKVACRGGEKILPAPFPIRVGILAANRPAATRALRPASSPAHGVFEPVEDAALAGPLQIPESS